MSFVGLTDFLVEENEIRKIALSFQEFYLNF